MVTKVETAPIGSMLGTLNLLELVKGFPGLTFPGGEGWRPIKRSTVAQKSWKIVFFVFFSDLASIWLNLQ